MAGMIFFMTGCGKSQAPGQVKAPSSTEAATEVQEEVLVPSDAPITEERVYYDFEGNLKGWEIPMWAQGKSDYVAKDIVISEDVASQGRSSMKFNADFPGGSWNAALVEIQQYLDLSSYRVIRVDIYVPENTPEGLKAKLILTIGDNWRFVEQSSSVPLVAGEWVTLTASIEPGSYDWKRIVPDKRFAEDVRKIAVRIESNRKPQYSGPIYVDNIRVGR
ncbi:MAG: glycan-binding surface protein [Candidatus Omnitrophica bacterium]|nr:glycan-binding surface protein [Candidatus Omnitrophota bacterium]